MTRVLTLALLVCCTLPATASAAAKPFGTLECPEQQEVRFCSGKIDTFDGHVVDTNVTLPKTGDGPFPLMILSHGWGGRKMGLTGHVSSASKPWADRGYAVLSITSRGFNESCGTPQNRADARCNGGWIKLDDTRYEIRDVQHLAGRLVDDGLVDPERIGVHGGSYGGGVSFALAMLRDRIMKPDGGYDAWTSPGGRQLRLAAAAPYIPWTDLVYSLQPNGRYLDYAIPEPEETRVPAGVMKQSFVSGLFALGSSTGFYAPPGADEEADLVNWYARISAGEPYDGEPVVRGIADQIYTFKSSIAILRDRPPAPTFVANGWTDDLFPVDEAIRMYNVFRTEFPHVPFAMMHFDFGHQRGQGKDPDEERYRAHVLAWMDRYVKGDRTAPALEGVEALTQTCPADAPSGGPFTAPTWEALHPGEVRYEEPAAKTFTSAGGDPRVAEAFDPIAGDQTGDGACAKTAGGDEAGTANWRLPPAAGPGFTLMGAPTIVADITTSGTFPQIVARLLDVGPDGQQTLVARGVYRPDASGRQVFQLHPNAWHFAAEHVPKLQLLGRDAPYVRASNGEFQVTVSNLELRLPVREQPGGLISQPKPLPLPPGRRAVPGVETEVVGSRPQLRRSRSRPRLRLVAGCRSARLRGRDVQKVKRLVVKRRGMKRRSDRRRPFRVGLNGGTSRRVRAVAVLRGGKRVRLRATVPRACAKRRR
ncbi:MAG TPA: CocE/NonD family hydrolase [Solirubrobacteraceae bacterium]|nr:CocE/NonD family hydrolase [Solirubrobacteraceae bacterium]